MRSSAHTRALQRNHRDTLKHELMDHQRARYEAEADVPAFAAEHQCSTSTSTGSGDDHVTLPVQHGLARPAGWDPT